MIDAILYVLLGGIIGSASTVIFHLAHNKRERFQIQPFFGDCNMAAPTDIVTALTNATDALNAVATALTTSAGEVTPPVDLTVIDQPLADLATAVTNLQTAATAVETAIKPAG